MSKYSVVTHELAEINLCLRNLDGAPHSTNQSHQANETTHAISTRSAPGYASVQQHEAQIGIPEVGQDWFCLLTHSSVCVF